MNSKNYYINMWLRYVLTLVKGKRENFSTTAAAEGHIGKRVFSTTEPVETIVHVENFVRIISLWVNKEKYDNYEAFEKDSLILARYTWKFFRKYGVKINEAHARK